MRKRKEDDRLSVVLQKVYDRRSDEARISPAWLATEALIELDPERQAPELVYQAAHLQLRQLARAICREKWESEPQDDGAPEQHDLFPDLQKRYPIAHGPNIEPEYVLLEQLTQKDWKFNVQRMKRSSEKLQKHADALQAWGESRFSKAA